MYMYVCIYIYIYTYIYIYITMPAARSARDRGGLAGGEGGALAESKIIKWI